MFHVNMLLDQFFGFSKCLDGVGRCLRNDVSAPTSRTAPILFRKTISGIEQGRDDEEKQQEDFDQKRTRNNLARLGNGSATLAKMFGL